jgi:hypothetical protein
MIDLIVAVVIVFYGILFIIDGYPVLKERNSKKKVAYVTIFAAAFLINILTVLKVKVPNPAKGISRIIELIIG